MKKHSVKSVIQQTLTLAAASLAVSSAQALSIDWSGNYRFEYTEVDKTSLDSPGLRKAYILNGLTLSPKIIAADGVNIVGRFEILTNDQYPDSQAGQLFGRGPNKAGTGTQSSTKDDSAVAGNKHGSSNLRVSQLYLNVNQEYGAFVAGRAPLEFGLGITHNAANGPFDHWSENRDLVGYKFIIGNFSFMPILGRVWDKTPAQGGSVQDLIWDIEYSNPETESSIGVFHQTRSGSDQSNDAPTAAYGASSIGGRWNTQHINIFFARGFEDVKFKLEAGFESGGTGLLMANGEEVSLNGYGIALDVDFPRPESKWSYNLRAGIASGDNPTTTNYEGFHFNRNYNLGFLLFNHPLGRFDILRTNAQRSPNRLTCAAATCGTYPTDEALDEETISNAIFVAPRAVYKISDKWDWANTFVWGQLQTNPLASNTPANNYDVSKDLGFEWDTGLVYKPHERIMWVNEVGMLFPGSAWAGGSNNYGKGFTYGFSSKAAISF